MATVSKAQAVCDAAEALRQAAASLGVSLTDDAIDMALGQAMGESIFGRAVEGYGLDMAGSNNWGSVISTPAWEAAHGGWYGWGKFAHTDSNGVRAYVAWFRIYPSQLEGAKGYLSTIGGAGALGPISQGPDAFAQYLKSRNYYSAAESTYATMLAGMQATIASLRAQAAQAGLTPADPSVVTSRPSTIAPLSARLTAALIATPTDENGHATDLPSGGVVWFDGGLLGDIVTRGLPIFGVAALVAAGALSSSSHARAMASMAWKWVRS